MSKNLIVKFVDWYLENREGKGVNYFEHSFKSDRDIFIATLSEYAVEFAIAHGYNPFLDDKENLSNLKSDLYQENNSFFTYSESKSKHMPRALLGKENYLKFLAELNDEKQESVSLKAPKPVKQTTNLYHYEQTELRKNFYFRLTTQDRYYEFLYFPISVLKKLFYNYDRKTFFDKWIEKQIDNIAVYTGKTDKIPFKELVSLDIKDDSSVLINGKFNLHTIVAGSETRDEISTNTLQNIVIDHIVPFESILFELKAQLPTLQIIHNVLENINEGRISNKGDLNNAGNYLVSNVDFSAQELDALEKDLTLILSKIQLQLMDRYENLYKRNK